ncbi:MAG: Fic family protein [Candidatus Kerfeldbacteria bacterium]|nr:Fic family protein [Candidatus Kerfeldbacteria bacterium]
MNKTITLNKRQDAILEYIKEHEQASIAEIFSFIQKTFHTVAKITINRDLKKLINTGWVIPLGAGRAVVYELSRTYALLQPIDVEHYFSVEPDQRRIHDTFQFDIFSQLNNIFSVEELNQLELWQKKYRQKIQQLPPDALKKEFERLTIELSWKSSKIEGNTYTLLETEELIRRQKQSPNHTAEEAIMILNHKKTLNYIQQNTEQFHTLSRHTIEEIHSLLIDGLGVSRNVRKILVRITGTTYTPLDNAYQIEDALEQLCKLINATQNPFEKAVIAMLLIAYIQPFVDGNKRTSRLIGNALLMAYDCCPLSYRSMDEMEYKKAMLLFYEQQHIVYFKKLFLEQYHFAIDHYFG